MRRHFVHPRRVVGAAALLPLLLAIGASSAEQGRGGARLEPLGHNDLGGPQGGGKGGEGIELKVFNGRRYLFTAAESGPNCFSVVDVTDPSRLQLVAQVDVPNANVRCNSLDLSGSVLAVAYQVAQVGQQPAGMRLYDVSDPASPTELSLFDTSGPNSRGVHHVWFVDGHYAYLATGSADFTP